jgi:hypothetical protein
MADFHYSEAERLCRPRPARYVPGILKQPPEQPAEPALAQAHATLAVADQLARIAAALERLADGQEGASTQ